MHSKEELLIKMLKDAYLKMYLSSRVNQQPISVHFKRKIKEYCRLLQTGCYNESLEQKVYELLKPRQADAQNIAGVADTDIEGAAQAVNNNG